MQHFKFRIIVELSERVTDSSFKMPRYHLQLKKFELQKLIFKKHMKFRLKLFGIIIISEIKLCIESK